MSCGDTTYFCLSGKNTYQLTANQINFLKNSMSLNHRILNEYRFWTVEFCTLMIICPLC